MIVIGVVALSRSTASDISVPPIVTLSRPSFASIVIVPSTCSSFEAALDPLLKASSLTVTSPLAAPLLSITVIAGASSAPSIVTLSDAVALSPSLSVIV